MSQPNNARSFRKLQVNTGRAKQNPGSGVPKPPGQGTSRSARRRRNRQLASASGYSANPVSASAWLSSPFTNSGYSSQNFVYGQTNPRAGQASMQGKRAPPMEYLAVDSDAGAKYIAAVLDPQNCDETTRVVDGCFAKETSTHKFKIPFRFNASFTGNFMLKVRPGVAWNTPMLSLYTGDQYEPDTGITGGVQPALYPKSLDMRADQVAEFRIVCASIQVRYVDTRDQQSGEFFYGFNLQDNVNDAQVPTTDQIDEWPNSDSCPTSISPEVLYFPKDSADTEFRKVDVENNRSCMFVQGVGLTSAAKMRGLLTVQVEFIRSDINRAAPFASAKSQLPGSIWNHVLNSVLGKNPKYIASPAGNENIYQGVLNKLSNTVIDQVSTVASKSIGGLIGNYLAGPFGGMIGSKLM